MNVGLAMVLSLGWLLFGLLVYSRLVSRWLGVDPSRVTPAVRLEDGVDYVPTGRGVLFGHHFASIAAAGPIVGPALAAAYGFVPAWLWLMFGVVFIGAMHDFVALFVSMREDGRSMAEVARRTLGRGGFVLYSLFAILLCILVSAAFLDLTAKTLTSWVPLAVLGLPADQTLLATALDGGVPKARIGGIASTSVVVITALAPVLGWALTKKKVHAGLAALASIAVCAASVWVGLAAPLTLAPSVWMGIVLVYTVLAGFLPVWLVIQPRDFINVQFLFAGLAVMVLALIGCGLHGVVIDPASLDAANLSTAADQPGLGMAWPFLFITIACGSVSGAHGLVAGGTTSKQLRSEADARWVGYGGMLLESLLGVCVLLLLVGAMGQVGYQQAVWAEGAPGAGVAFALAMGQGIWKGLGSPEGATWLAAYGTVFGILLLEGFLVTTIDTLVRLSRYLVEELWRALLDEPPAWASNRVLNTLLIVIPVAGLAFTSGYKSIWPIFGAANQLLAAMTLIAAALWLAQRGRAWWFVAVPAAFMTATTLVALAVTASRALALQQWAVVAASATLLALAVGVLALVAGVLFQGRPTPEPAA